MVLKAKYLLGLCLLGLGIGSANAVASAPAVEVRAQTAGHELAIIDGAVADSELLRQGLRPGIEVVTLPSGVDPLSQLQTILADHPGLSALHLISHGTSGALQLGSSRLDERTLQHHPEVAQALAAAIVPNGDLLLYGCDVAAGTAGQSFIKTLRQQTGLNIAASDNLTGASALGGDWILERQQGRRLAGLAFQPAAVQAYTQVLVAPSAENFDSQISSNPYASSLLSSTSISSSGWTFSASAPGSIGVVDSTIVNAELVNGDQAFIFDSLGSPGAFSFQSTDGSEFYLNSVELESIDASVNVQAYKDGSPVGMLASINLAASGTSSIFSYSHTDGGYNYGTLSITYPMFYPVDKITISAPSGILLLDTINISNVDTTSPTVSYVTAPSNGTYRAGSSLYFTIQFDEAVFLNTSGGTPHLALTLGNETVYADYYTGSGGSTLTFRYAIPSGKNDSDGITVGALSLNGGTMKDAAGNNATLTLNNVASTSSVLVDTTAPTVTSVAVPSNGTYTTGQGLDFRVNFDDVVNVTGTPRIALTLGGSTVYANYVSGGGSSALTFRHTVQAGENDVDGITVGALGLNSGTLKDDAGNDATLTLNSVGSTTGVLVDASAPTVTSVAVPSNGTYTTGQSFDFRVNFDDVVNVTGTPHLAVTLGSSGVYASYVSGSGTSSLTLRYTVKAGDNDSDGISVGALLANGGTLKDDNGNNATLTLNSVDSTSSVLVDASAPTVGSVSVPSAATYIAGQTLNFTVNFNESVTVDTSGGTPRLALTLGSSTVYANYVAGSGSSALAFHYTVQNSENDSDGIAVGTLGLNGGTLKDAAGNDATLTLNNVASTSGVRVDATAPTVTDGNISISGGSGGAFKIGDTVTVTWNNGSGGDNNSDISAVTVNFSAFGGGSAVTASNSAGTWTATYTLTAGAIDATNLNVSATATDNAGNATTTADTTNASVDTQAPTVTDAQLTISGASGTGGAFKVGDTVTATWNNTASGDNNGDISAVTVDFSAFGGSTVTASNSSGTWTATYTLVAGAINGSNRNVSVTATDNAGNTTITADTSNATVDNVAPTVNSVAVPTNGTYVSGQNLDFTVNFSEAVTVDTNGGTPRLALTLGSSTVYADYLSGSGTSSLTLRYTVQAGANDSDGISVGAMSANGGTLRDAVGNNATLTLNSVGSTSSVLVDTTTPTVDSVAVPANGTYVSGQNLDFTVDFNEAVTVDTNGGTPRIALTLGSSTVYANYVSGSGSSVLTFRHTVQAGENDADGIAVGALGLNGSTIKDAAGNDATLTLNSVGSTSSVLVDTSAPTVTSVAVPVNGTYTTGQILDFTVNFNEAVTANTSGGTPRLALTLGSSTVYASYVSGSGGSALNFSYTVQAGDNDSDGITVGSLGLNGGTLKDAVGNDATLTLNSVGSTSSVLVDTSAPAVTSVAVPSNGTYTMGQSLDFTVNFDEAVTVTGTPHIALMVGSSTVYANYLSGSGTAALTFRHTVQAGEDDTNGIAVGALGVNGGTLQDASGNNATLTLNSVASTASVLVDTLAPVVTSVAVPANGSYAATQTLDFTVNFGEAVVVDTSGGTPRLVLTVGSSTVYANYLSGSGTAALTFRHTVQADENDADGIAVGALGANGGTLKDAAGNDATLVLNSVGSTSSVLVDTLAPVVTSVAVPANGSYAAPQTLDFTVNFGEAVVVDTSGGTPRLALTVGSSTMYANYLSGSGTAALTFRHTVQAGENDADGIAVGALDANGGTLKDAAGNDATRMLNSVGSTSSVLVDTTAPTVISVSVPANGTYTTGQILDFTVNFSEAVTANTSGGTPRLALTLGSSTVYASYVSGSGGSALNFSYTVQAGDNDSDGITVGSLGLNGGTLKDAAGNDAALTLNGVGNTSALMVDTSAPVVSSVAVPANGTYITGQSLAFSVNFSQAVTVDTGGGTPYLALTVGSSPVQASYVSGSGSTTLIFSYLIQAGELDTDGVAVGSLSAHGGSLRDGVGNDASLTLNSVASTSAVLVDAVAPTLSSSSPADNSTGVAFDANVQLVLSEAITAGSGTLAIYDAADDSLVEANTVGSSRVTISGNTVTLDPLATLLPTHSYYLQVGAQALLDAAGNAYAGISDKTTLNFTVANVAPVAQADSASTQEDSAVQVDVTANDSDADSALNKASVTVVTAAQHGTTSVDTGTGVISYTPASNYNGSDSFSYRVQDIYGANSNVVTVSVTVQPVNDAPQAVADIESTIEDAALTIDVLANDSDIDSGDSLNPATLTLVTSPAHGTAQISHGQVSYTPAANFNGSDTFSYTVADQHGAISNVATVMINVGSSNDAPVAGNDTASTDEDHAVSVDVLANDSDMDGTLVPASIALLQQPAHGQVMLNGATGALVYTPAANYFGQDSFSYAVQDNEGATSNAASVTVTVNSINDAPVATNNSVTLQEDASLSINVLGNDSDVDGTLVPASVQLMSQPAHGSATVSNTDGSVLYIPTSNAVGDDSFSYRVQDDQGVWSNVATVTMTIQSVNDAPLANADQGDLDEDGALALHLLDNDSDIDGSLQDVHIITQPASGSLDVGSSGDVTYTPAANFHGSDVFSYQAVDNEGALSPTVVVTLTVRAVNDAPTISGNGAATLLEGASYQFAPVINDVDGDELTVTASGLPQWLTINSRTGELNGTPAVGQAGQYDTIVLTVSDGTVQTALPAFALTVQADLDGDGLANTVDADDDNDGMSDGYEDDHDFNPLDPSDATTDADQDGVSNQQESVDGTNPHNASDYLDTTAPVVSAVADVTVDATGLFTPVTVRKLLGLADTVSDDEVATELRALSSDNMDGAACCSVTIDGMTDNQLLLAPGRHDVIYQATDRKGNVGTVTQLVRVRPLVSMSKDQVAVPGQSLSFSIILNGPAPDYPFTVPYALDDRSTLSTDQHSLQAGSVTFTSGQTALTVPVSLGADAAASGNQTLVVRLDDQTSDEQDLAGGYDPMAPDSHDINAGAKSAHVITVTTGNVAPQVELSLQQNGQQTMLVTPNGGSVTVTATVRDLNAADTHTFDWSGTAAGVVDTDENLTDAALVFDPAGLAEGVYPVQVTVTDSQGARTLNTLYFRVVTSLPELSAESDTDGDGVSDRVEGVADSDNDGIVNYLDNLATPNLLPEALATTEAFVMECDPGVLCRLGQYALQNGTSGSRLLASDLASLPSVRQDSRFTPVGGIFDFEIAELPTAGQSVSVVIPLNEAIPANAVYRKFLNGRWRTFVEDDNNQLHSAPGSLGYCPPPGDAQWTAGLIAGNYCVQLTLEDGGPNDADGVVNASIADPGAVSVSTADDTDDDGSGSVGGAGLLALWALQRYRRRDRGEVRH